MNITEFQLVNAKRAKRWHNDGETEWNYLEWAGAMCGEAGESANVAKKILRLDMNLPTANADSDRMVLEDKLSREIADTIIYGLIILSELRVDATRILAEVFDKKSIEHGFPERAPR